MKLTTITAAVLLTALLGTAPQLQARSPADCVAKSAAAAAAVERAPVTEQRSPRCRGAAGAQAFARTELFFGLSRPGGVITEEQFKGFVDASVTPRFPDGLTLLTGTGQFRDSSGTIIVEGSKLLVLLYPFGDREADAKIEQIRSEYVCLFDQQSVLRADDASCVSF